MTYGGMIAAQSTIAMWKGDDGGDRHARLKLSDAAMSMGPPRREFGVKRRRSLIVGRASIIGHGGAQYKREVSILTHRTRIKTQKKCSPQ